MDITGFVEVPDPPIPSRANTLVPETSSEKNKTRMTGAVMTLLTGWATYALFANHHIFWGVVVGLFALLFLNTVFSNRTFMVGVCPFCGNRMKAIPSPREGMFLRCKFCSEYSVLRSNKVYPLESDTISETPKFESPVFESPLWPAGCVACGAPPTRLDELKGSTVNAVGLALGRVYVHSGRMRGVPYCNRHQGNLELKVSQTRELTFHWCSLRMMRRYVALNRRATQAKTSIIPFVTK